LISTLRSRFGIPGVIAVVALVFAMLGGAYAASDSGGGATAAKAKKGPPGPRGKQGPKGPAGPQGAAGANGKDGANGQNGANGEDGLPGTDGDDGDDGKSVVVANEPTATGNCGGRGGSSFQQEGSITKTYACNGEKGEDGEDGETGFTETLPSGETETGVWAGGKTDEIPSVVSSISFTIPLGSALDADHVIRYSSAGTTPAEQANCDDGVGPAPSAVNPEADPGYLCVFQGVVSGEVLSIKDPATGGGGAATAGAEVGAEPHPFTGGANGTWAVTAPIAP